MNYIFYGLPKTGEAGMKEADAKVEYQEHQMLLYVEKSDGSYGPLQTGSYMSKNYIDDFWTSANALKMKQSKN